MHSDTFGSRPGFRYTPDSLGRLNQGRFVRENDLPDPFGRLLAQPEPEPVITNFKNPFRLRRSVGMEGANGRRDVAKVENLLGRAGSLDLNETDGVTGFFGARADEAVKGVQKRLGLNVDGLITPKGPTLRALAAEAGQGDGDLGFPRPAAPAVPPGERPGTPPPDPAAPGKPSPDPRRYAIKRAATKLLEMRKAGIDPRAQLLARRLAAADAGGGKPGGGEDGNGGGG